MAAKTAVTFCSRVLEELGVYSILHSSRDTKLLCLQRFVRLSAYGASTLILALYLSSLGSSDARIGLFMTLTLLGDVVISFLLTLVADGLGRRRILVLGAVLMSVSGVVFALSGNYWVLVTASIIGVISPRYDSCLKMHSDTDPLSVGTRSAHSAQSKSRPSLSSHRKRSEATYSLGIHCLAALEQHVGRLSAGGLCKAFLLLVIYPKSKPIDLYMVYTRSLAL